jgi:hypothetical protein
MENKDEKLKKLLFTIIDKLSKDADVYHHDESLWLIHTEDREWIIEFDYNGILWFNYNFFRTAFKFISLDVDNNRSYVTEWFESRFLNKPKVEDDIQNGVKDVRSLDTFQIISVEDAIQNGVKDTITSEMRSRLTAENIIENGVKHTLMTNELYNLPVEDTIQNGVKHTRPWTRNHLDSLEDTIQNGIKHPIKN